MKHVFSLIKRSYDRNQGPTQQSCIRDGLRLGQPAVPEIVILFLDLDHESCSNTPILFESTMSLRDKGGESGRFFERFI
jgi:hypothetical protein